MKTYLILVGGFHHGPGGDHLGPYHAWECAQCGKSRRDVFASRESGTGIGDDVSNNGQHGNTSVLELEKQNIAILRTTQCKDFSIFWVEYSSSNHLPKTYLNPSLAFEFGSIGIGWVTEGSKGIKVSKWGLKKQI